MKRIVIGEDNFESILLKIQNICNKYKMIYSFEKFIGNVDELNVTKTHKILYTKRKNNTFVHVTKDSIREAYEKYEGNKLYTTFRPLINMNITITVNVTLFANDIISFLSSGGFIIYAFNKYSYHAYEIHKYVFIPDIKNGKITNLQEEINKRENDSAFNYYNMDDNYYNSEKINSNQEIDDYLDEYDHYDSIPYM